MNAFLTFLGEYSWGLIHPIFRDFFFWILLVAAIVLAIIFLVNFQKSKPSGRKIPPGLEHRIGYKDDHDKEVRRKAEVAQVRNYAIFAALLFFFPTIKILGSIAYSNKIETSIEKMPPVTITLGKSILRGGKDYTCSKGILGDVFTYQPSPGSLAIEAGSSLTDTTTVTKVFKPTWWGSIPHFKKTELTYVCKP